LVKVPGKLATFSVGNGVTKVTPFVGLTGPVLPDTLVATLKSVFASVPTPGLVNPESANRAGVLAASVHPVPVVIVTSPAEGEFTTAEGAVHGFTPKPETVVKVVDEGIETPVKLTVMVELAVSGADAVKPISQEAGTPAAVVVGTKLTAVTAAEAFTSKPSTEATEAVNVRHMETTRNLFNTLFNT
jgi:hypothetical protein